MNGFVDVQKKGFNERFHVDSRGRRWDFVQRERLHEEFGPYGASGRRWNEEKLVWVCRACGGEEPVRYEHLIHDEVTVRDPTEQLDAHSCDVERVRQVMES